MSQANLLPMGNPLSHAYFYGVGIRSLAFQAWLVGVPIYFQQNIGAIGGFSEALSISGLGIILGMLFAFGCKLGMGPVKKIIIFDGLQFLCCLAMLPLAFYKWVGFWELTLFMTFQQFCYGGWLVSNEAFLGVAVKQKGQVSLFHMNFTAVMSGGFLGAVVAEWLVAQSQLIGLISLILTATLVSHLVQREELWPRSAMRGLQHDPLSGLRYILASKPLLSMTLFGMFNRVLILGIVPFVPFLIRDSGGGDGSVSLTVGLYKFGLILGGLPLASWLFWNRSFSFPLVVASIGLLGVGLTAALAMEMGTILVATILACLGFMVAKNAIPMRTLRSSVTDKGAMATVVGLQSLCFHLTSPLSSLLLGGFFADGSGGSFNFLLGISYGGFFLVAFFYVWQLNLKVVNVRPSLRLESLSEGR